MLKIEIRGAQRGLDICDLIDFEASLDDFKCKTLWALPSKESKAGSSLVVILFEKSAK